MAPLSKELIAASSVPLLLALLREQESYGYELIQRLKQASGGRLQFADGTLYPILRKLEERGLIASEWRVAENAKRRRYYRVSPQGVQQVELEKANWDFLHTLLAHLWNRLPLGPA